MSAKHGQEEVEDAGDANSNSSLKRGISSPTSPTFSSQIPDAKRQHFLPYFDPFYVGNVKSFDAINLSTTTTSTSINGRNDIDLTYNFYTGETIQDKVFEDQIQSGLRKNVLRKSAAIDEFELDQLLQNLPTSVDDFQKKELSLKQQKSPFISQRSSPLTQNEGYIIDSLGQDISSSNSSTHSIAKSPSFEMELDANDLEVAMINESFEQELKQSQIYENKDLRRLFYKTDINEHTEQYDDEHCKQHFGQNSDQQDESTLDASDVAEGIENFKADDAFACYNIHSILPSYGVLEFNSYILKDDKDKFSNCSMFNPCFDTVSATKADYADILDEEQAKTIAYGIVETLLSSPTALAASKDDLELDGDIVDGKAELPSFTPTMDSDDELILTDSVLKEIRNELFEMMDDDTDEYECDEDECDEDLPKVPEQPSSPEETSAKFGDILLMKYHSRSLFSLDNAEKIAPTSPISKSLEDNKLANVKKMKEFEEWHKTSTVLSKSDFDTECYDDYFTKGLPHVLEVAVNGTKTIEEINEEIESFGLSMEDIFLREVDDEGSIFLLVFTDVAKASHVLLTAQHSLLKINPLSDASNLTKTKVLEWRSDFKMAQGLDWKTSESKACDDSFLVSDDTYGSSSIYAASDND